MRNTRMKREEEKGADVNGEKGEGQKEEREDKVW